MQRSSHEGVSRPVVPFRRKQSLGHRVIKRGRELRKAAPQLDLPWARSWVAGMVRTGARPEGRRRAGEPAQAAGGADPRHRNARGDAAGSSVAEAPARQGRPDSTPRAGGLRGADHGARRRRRGDRAGPALPPSGRQGGWRRQAAQASDVVVAVGGAIRSGSLWLDRGPAASSAPPPWGSALASGSGPAGLAPAAVAGRLSRSASNLSAPVDGEVGTRIVWPSGKPADGGRPFVAALPARRRRQAALSGPLKRARGGSSHPGQVVLRAYLI